MKASLVDLGSPSGGPPSEGPPSGGGGGGSTPPPSPPGSSPPVSSGGSRHRQGSRRMNQDELRRQMDLLAEDAHQRTKGRNIQKVTHTNTVTTVYEDGGPPMSVRTSSHIRNP